MERYSFDNRATLERLFPTFSPAENYIENPARAFGPAETQWLQVGARFPLLQSMLQCLSPSGYTLFCLGRSTLNSDRDSALDPPTTTRGLLAVLWSSSPLCTCLVLDYKLFSTYNGNGGSITLHRAIFLAVCSKNDCSATIGITYLHRANFFLTKKEHWKFATWSHSGSYYGYRGALATLFSLPRPRLASMGNRLAICERKRNMQSTSE